MNKPSLPLQSKPLSMPQTIDIGKFKKTLVFIPHPDDEAIGCGGLLHKLYQQHTPTTIILVTDGSGAGELPDGTVEKRCKEFNASLDILHPVAERIFWNLPDGKLQDTPKLNEMIDQVLSTISPTEVISPWNLDLHPDHATIGKTVLALANKIESLYFYEVWSPIPANAILNISEVITIKEAALQKHATALECGDYLRAMRSLNAYRSLLTEEMAKNNTYAEAYYKVLSTQHNAESFHLEDVTLDHKTVIEKLFKEIYGSLPARDWWTWKYHNELIKGVVAIDSQGCAIGFYGNLSRRAHFQNKEYWCSQITDVMIKTEFRQAGKQSGLFYQLSQTFLDENVGDNKRYSTSLGFPHPRALSLGIKMKLYKAGSPLLTWSKDINKMHFSPKSLLFSYRFLTEPNSENLEWVNNLYKAMLKSDIASLFVLERSNTYWKNRFFNRPDKHYDCLKVSFLGQTIAGAVICTENNKIELIDLVFKEVSHIKHLLKALELHANRLGVSTISTWGTHSFIEQLGSSGLISNRGWMALPSEQIGSSLTDRIAHLAWITPGDADFT